MIDYLEYRARLHRHLDERSDPLDDPQVVAFLDAHPEHLHAFADERADLDAIAGLPETATLEPAPEQFAATRRTSTAQRWAYVAAAAAVIGLSMFQLGRLAGPGTATDSKATSNAQDHGKPQARPSRILSATLQEVEPTLRTAAFYTVHDNLVQTATITLEAYEQRSELR